MNGYTQMIDNLERYAAWHNTLVHKAVMKYLDETYPETRTIKISPSTVVFTKIKTSKQRIFYEKAWKRFLKERNKLSDKTK